MTRALPWISVVLAAAALAASLVGREGADLPEDVLRKSDLYDLRDRVDALEASASGLDARIAALAAAQGAEKAQVSAVPAAEAPSPSASGSAAEVQALKGQIAELRGQIQKIERSRQAAPDPQSPEFKTAVENAQREMRNERVRQHRERMEQDRLNSMEEFVAANGLSSDDARELRRILDEDSAKSREFFETMMSGEGMQNREEQRERMKAMREELNAEVERILEPELAKKFQDSVLRQAFRAPPPPTRR